MIKQYSFLIESIFNVKRKSDVYELDNIKDIKSRIKWCQENFKNDGGKGCGRIVYKIPNSNYVLKLAYNYKGLIQNKNEYNFYYDCDKNPVLAKCFEKGKNYNWLISEYCYTTCDNDDEKNLKYLEILKKINSITKIDWRIFYTICGLIILKDSRKMLDDNHLRSKLFEFLKKVQQNGKKILELRKSNKREEFFDYVHNKLLHPDLLKYSEKHNHCLHYFFHICVWYIYGCTDDKLNELFKILNNKSYLNINFIKDLISLSNNTKIDPYLLRDSMHPANMGIVKRNNKDEIVLLDYGYEDDMRSKKPGRKTK